MRARPYLLLQCRDASDPMREHEVRCFATTLAAAVKRIHVVDMLARVPAPEEVGSCRAVLIGGSGAYSTLDREPWIGRMVDWLSERLLDAGVPTFGSCFGLQALTLALGGRVVRDPENREVGTVTVWTTPEAKKDPVFGAAPRAFLAQAGHTDHPADVPPGTSLLASSDRCHVHAFRVNDRPIWATQFHPELDPDAVRTRYLAYMEKYPPPDLPPGTPLSEAPFLQALRPSPHATRILQRFAHWARVREFAAK